MTADGNTGTAHDVDLQVPVIDLSPSTPESELAAQIANACATFGFFQITSHGVPIDLMSNFKTQMRMFFDLPYEKKGALRRNECNARGFFDDELTKQRKDWKEGFDLGVPGSRDWATADNDGTLDNACLDGFNYFPDQEDLPEFRSTIVTYFNACAELSDRVAHLMSLGLGVAERPSSEEGDENEKLANRLRSEHTSYLRMNYYPPCPENESVSPPPLGISPHTDAGFLTVLVQDDDCHSLQVAYYKNGRDAEPDWITVKPVPGAFTINTGAMAQIWSNDRYVAPLHRVLTDPMSRRYSAPFFYNPGYEMTISPLPRLGRPKYKPCNWGYFRAVRFAGDLTDFGTEIQISDYSTDSKSSHPEKQKKFLKEADFGAPFSVEKYRPLLEMKTEGVDQ